MNSLFSSGTNRTPWGLANPGREARLPDSVDHLDRALLQCGEEDASRADVDAEVVDAAVHVGKRDGLHEAQRLGGEARRAKRERGGEDSAEQECRCHGG